MCYPKIKIKIHQRGGNSCGENKRKKIVFLIVEKMRWMNEKMKIYKNTSCLFKYLNGYEIFT